MVGNNTNRYCKDCNVRCSDYNYGPCIFWRGPASACYEIPHWKDSDTYSLQDAVNSIMVNTCEYYNRNLTRVSCSSQLLEPGPAISCLNDKLEKLNTDDIFLAQGFTCLGVNSSVYSVQLGTRSFKFSVSPTSSGHSSLSYDLSDAINNLPDNFSIINKQVNAYSYNSETSLNSKLMESGDAIGQFELAGDQFPIGLNFSIDVGTPGGIVTMQKKLSLDAPQPQSANSVFDLEDKTSKKGFGAVQTDFNTAAEAAICNLNRKVDTYRSVDIAGCDKVKYFSKDIGSVVGVHGGHLCAIYDRLDKIGDEPIKGIDCNENCEKRQYDTTIQSYFLQLGNENCSLKQRVKNLEDRLYILEKKLENCCK